MIQDWTKLALTGAGLAATMAAPASARMEQSMVSDVLSGVDVCYSAMSADGMDFAIFEASGFVEDKDFTPARDETLRSWTLRDRPMVLITFIGKRGEPQCGISLTNIASMEYSAMYDGLVRSHGEPDPSMSKDGLSMWVANRKIIMLANEGPAESQQVTVKVSYYVE